ncbi:glucose/sorbosone dehydrogenase [Beggiatoa alba B18LD]|uniref:Glucose/sorbosone dehydrogenase n=1 Tax=Beggiatoa alba B18LD TaxID=395493 RepID=I3CD97_9GAMM|nr:PQQ-dependent sugar dehydrogenase [Beggiatoa alba]EIJ41590.1 glucose/sorbosone dehydrogenase [Beggiatoa alba B18LD]
MRSILYSVFTSLLLSNAVQAVDDKTLPALKLPTGFKITTYAHVPEARSLAVDSQTGVVYVSSRNGDTIHALIDKNHDATAEIIIPIISKLNSPNGIALHPQTGDLYIAEQHQIRRIPAAQLAPLAKGEKPTIQSSVIFNELPNKRWHGWRYIKFSPAGQLYVAVGAPCNICDVQGFEGTIMRLNADGSNAEIFARGIRNSVGFDFHPVNNTLYFTDNGADNLGDDIPPCELNRASETGLHFGFPYVWGKNNTPYPNAEKRTLPAQPVAPLVEFPAHSAPLGIHFIQGQHYPKDYQHSALIALHGSWNRNPNDPAGYKVVRVTFNEQGEPLVTTDFITGWLDADKKAWGRPVDIAQLADDSILISDDRADMVYRLVYVGQ